MDKFAEILTLLFSTTNFPALILLAMLVAFFIAANKAQKRDDFDWGEILREDLSDGKAGKLSAVRIGTVAYIIVSSWLMVFFAMTIVKTAADLAYFFNYFLAFIVTLSGSKAVEKALDIVITKFFPKTP